MLGVAFSGKQRAGKSTIARATVEELRARGIPAEIVSLAGPLKAAYGAVVSTFRFDEQIPFTDATKHLHRPGLIALGKALREYHADAWVLIALARARQLYDQGIIPVVDDLRFWNEAHHFKENDFLLVRLEVPRSVRVERGPLVSEDDPSETDLDDFTGWDVVADWLEWQTHPDVTLGHGWQPGEIAGLMASRVQARRGEDVRPWELP